MQKEWEEVDKQLKEFYTENKLRIKFCKISDGIYTFAGKKIHLKLVNGKQSVKVDDGYLSIHQYIKEFHPDKVPKHILKVTY